MKGTTIFKLKQHVTEDDLVSAGYRIACTGVCKELPSGCEIYISLIESSSYEQRVIQYNELGTDPEELNPEDIEDLVARGWVEEIKK